MSSTLLRPPISRRHVWPHSSPENRFFDAGDSSDPRSSSDSLAPPLGFPNATRARMVLARTLGILGILATVALAVFAFRSRAPEVASRVGGIDDAVRLPWDPVLNAGPPPLALERRAAVVPLAVSIAPTDATPMTPMPFTPAEPAAPTAAPSSSAPIIPAGESENEPSLVPKPAPEPRFTPEEVQRRKDRYERWLEEQRLERIR